mgnify:CR=1 FL=1
MTNFVIIAMSMLNVGNEPCITKHSAYQTEIASEILHFFLTIEFSF